MDTIDFTKIALAFGGLLVLLGLFYFGMRLLSGSGRFGGRWRPGQRIGVIETMPVDGSRRLVLVRRDDTEHLLLLGSDGDLVIETGIVAPPPQEPDMPGPITWPTLHMPGRNRDA
ncbi:MAG TPA: hypothetical protein VF194_01520 [Ferrovibrio sp.]|uniref:hypothetical protein n=1 Tax=Ferrovibrio sp. TaxID=1917215 RepID=UPI002ED19B4B